MPESVNEGTMTHPVPRPMTVPIHGSDRQFPVRRIYCVGRNYAAHAHEMGMDPERDAPFFFTKWADTIVPSGSTVKYPPATEDFQYEIELVVAIGRSGHDIAPTEASRHIFGYAVGIDMTRRDLQQEARDHGRPWDTGKNFDAAAPLGPLHATAAGDYLSRGPVWLDVNGVRKQESDLAHMIWSPEEIISHLSRMYTLLPGDLIFTGTPEGVGPVVPGDRVVGGVATLETLEVRIE